jgi:PAS domain S-box-containing protein
MSASFELGTELRLFVVDDDDDTRSNLRDILELDGYQVAEASCAKDLFALPGWESVAVILLDRRLPDGSPEQLLPRIKARAPQASVIVVTGFADIQAAVSALRLGAADYIIKPVNAEGLLASVRREIGHQRSERQLNALFENALDGLVIFDPAENVIDANPAACSIFSVPRVEFLGCNLRSVAGLRSDNVEPLFNPSQPRGELEIRRKDGAASDVEYQVTFNFFPGRNLVSIRDVSERKRAEQRVLQTERLAAIGETVAALAHESRNALQRSVTCLDILATEVEDRPIAVDLVRRAKKSQQLLQQLYEEVRHWAAPINLEFQRANLSHVWREAWQHVKQVHAKRNVQLREFVAGDLHCRIDSDKIGQVFRNIFENAIEVSPDPGVIELSCSPSTANDLSIKILDQGPGLSAEQLARAFEPFFTTKARGTGLGLSISNRIVQAHQGKIRASSPSGACFEITLPRGIS